MLGLESYESKEYQACNQTQKEVQIQLDTLFIKEAASYVNPHCPGEKLQ